MRHEELFYLLALLSVDGVGDVTAKKLLSHCDCAESLLKTKPEKLARVEGIGTRFLSAFKDKSIFKKAEAELRFIQENQINFTIYSEPGYPERLKHCPDGPVILFQRGNIDLQNPRMISIVGTRQITSYGMDFCKNLIAGLAPLGPTIVSGFAFGVDIAAHLSAVEHQLQTIGVLAHGLNQIYPKAHRRYVSPMEQNGGFLTEFRSTAEPLPEHFVRRNRIVAGLSEATIVIESADKGGSLITANMAGDYNREVFAVPGRAGDKYSQGCNNLIKSQRAQLITGAEDLIYLLNWDLQPKAQTVQKQLLVVLEANEQKVYDYLKVKGKELLDIVALECQIPVSQLSGILLQMELKGVVRPLPGKQFEAV